MGVLPDTYGVDRGILIGWTWGANPFCSQTRAQDHCNTNTQREQANKRFGVGARAQFRAGARTCASWRAGCMLGRIDEPRRERTWFWSRSAHRAVCTAPMDRMSGWMHYIAFLVFFSLWVGGLLMVYCGVVVKNKKTKNSSHSHHPGTRHLRHTAGPSYYTPFAEREMCVSAATKAAPPVPILPPIMHSCSATRPEN